MSLYIYVPIRSRTQFSQFGLARFSVVVIFSYNWYIHTLVLFSWTNAFRYCYRLRYVMLLLRCGILCSLINLPCTGKLIALEFPVRNAAFAYVSYARVLMIIFCNCIVSERITLFYFKNSYFILYTTVKCIIVWLRWKQENLFIHAKFYYHCFKTS